VPRPGAPLAPPPGALVCARLRSLVLLGLAVPRGGPPSPPACALRAPPRGCPPRGRAGLAPSAALAVRLPFCRRWGVPCLACPCAPGPPPLLPRGARRLPPSAASPAPFPRAGAACRAPGRPWRRPPVRSFALVCARWSSLGWPCPAAGPLPRPPVPCARPRAAALPAAAPALPPLPPWLSVCPSAAGGACPAWRARALRARPPCSRAAPAGCPRLAASPAPFPRAGAACRAPGRPWRRPRCARLRSFALVGPPWAGRAPRRAPFPARLCPARAPARLPSPRPRRPCPLCRPGCPSALLPPVGRALPGVPVRSGPAPPCSRAAPAGCPRLAASPAPFPRAGAACRAPGRPWRRPPVRSFALVCARWSSLGWPCPAAGPLPRPPVPCARPRAAALPAAAPALPPLPPWLSVCPSAAGGACPAWRARALRARPPCSRAAPAGCPRLLPPPRPSRALARRAAPRGAPGAAPGALVCARLRSLVLLGLAVPRGGPPSPPACALRAPPRGCPPRGRAGLAPLPPWLSVCPSAAGGACPAWRARALRARPPCSRAAPAGCPRLLPPPRPSRALARRAAPRGAPGAAPGALVCARLRSLVLLGLAVPRGGPPSPPACALRAPPRGCPPRGRAGLAPLPPWLSVCPSAAGGACPAWRARALRARPPCSRAAPAGCPRLLPPPRPSRALARRAAPRGAPGAAPRCARLRSFALVGPPWAGRAPRRAPFPARLCPARAPARLPSPRPRRPCPLCRPGCPSALLPPVGRALPGVPVRSGPAPLAPARRPPAAPSAASPAPFPRAGAACRAPGRPWRRPRCARLRSFALVGPPWAGRAPRRAPFPARLCPARAPARLPSPRPRRPCPLCRPGCPSALLPPVGRALPGVPVRSGPAPPCSRAAPAGCPRLAASPAPFPRAGA
ncbi:hypothetical protein BU14_2062s0001, partial [Porphyra umbilicalis]